MKKGKSMQKTGIVILNYKTYQDVFSCVDSIKSTIEDLPYKIYIVDNCSPNESLEKLTEKYGAESSIEVISSQKNNGFSAGNNIGLKKAIEDGCDAVLCTNPDVIFKNGAIKIMLESLFSSEDIGVIGPKVYGANGEIQNRNKGILTPLTFVLRRRAFRFLDWFKLEKKYTYYNYDYSKPLFPKGMVSGCCFMIKAPVLKEIDYLDENVFLFHEEDILGAKLRKINKKVMLNPSAEVIHAEGKATGGTNPFTRYCTFYSGLYYLWTYSGASKFAFNFASFMIKFLLFTFSLINKGYRQYQKKLREEIRALKKTKRIKNAKS